MASCERQINARLTGSRSNRVRLAYRPDAPRSGMAARVAGAPRLHRRRPFHAAAALPSGGSSGFEPHRRSSGFMRLEDAEAVDTRYVEEGAATAASVREQGAAGRRRDLPSFAGGRRGSRSSRASTTALETLEQESVRDAPARNEAAGAARRLAVRDVVGWRGSTRRTFPLVSRRDADDGIVPWRAASTSRLGVRGAAFTPRRRRRGFRASTSS